MVGLEEAKREARHNFAKTQPRVLVRPTAYTTPPPPPRGEKSPKQAQHLALTRYGLERAGLDQRILAARGSIRSSSLSHTQAKARLSLQVPPLNALDLHLARQPDAPVHLASGGMRRCTRGHQGQQQEAGPLALASPPYRLPAVLNHPPQRPPGLPPTTHTHPTIPTITTTTQPWATTKRMFSRATAAFKRAAVLPPAVKVVLI